MQVHVLVLLAVLSNITFADVLRPHRRLVRYAPRHLGWRATQLTETRPGRWDRRFLNHSTSSIISTTFEKKTSLTILPSTTSTTSIQVNVASSGVQSGVVGSVPAIGNGPGAGTAPEPSPTTLTQNPKTTTQQTTTRKAATSSGPKGQAGSVPAVGNGPGAGTAPEPPQTTSTHSAKPTTARGAIAGQGEGITVVPMTTTAQSESTGSVVAAGGGASIGSLSSSLNIPLGTGSSLSVATTTNAATTNAASTIRPKPFSTGSPRSSTAVPTDSKTNASQSSASIASPAAPSAPKLPPSHNRTTSIEPHTTPLPSSSVSVSESTLQPSQPPASALRTGSISSSVATQPSSGALPSDAAAISIPAAVGSSSLEQAQRWEADNKKLTSETPCNPTDPYQKAACIGGKLGTCRNGKFILSSCLQGQECFPMPNAELNGITIRCASRVEAEKAGVVKSSSSEPSGNTASDSSSSFSAQETASETLPSSTKDSSVSNSIASASQQASQASSSAAADTQTTTTGVLETTSSAAPSLTGSSPSFANSASGSVPAVPSSTASETSTVVTTSTLVLVSTVKASSSSLATEASNTADSITPVQTTASSAETVTPTLPSKTLSSTTQEAPSPAETSTAPSPALSDAPQGTNPAGSGATPSTMSGGGIVIVPTTLRADASTANKLGAATPAPSTVSNAVVAQAPSPTAVSEFPTNPQAAEFQAITITGKDDRVTIRETLTVTVTA